MCFDLCYGLKGHYSPLSVNITDQEIGKRNSVLSENKDRSLEIASKDIYKYWFCSAI